MRFAGIDVGKAEHVVAIVDLEGGVLVKATKFTEDASGYARLLELLGSRSDLLVAMEATGHYWQNMFAALAAAGVRVALLNPLRTRRFAEGDLTRAKTDAIDALSIARFAQQKRPAATDVTEQATQELRALVRHRDHLVQAFGDSARRLHVLIDLGFPEFTRHVKDPSCMLGTSILLSHPTARAFAGAEKRLAKICYDGRHKVGPELAAALVTEAKTSVGAHHGAAHQVQVRHLCEELGLLRRQLRELDDDLKKLLEQHQVGSLLAQIDGIGDDTALRIVAELGDPARFKSAAALASYVGVAPAIRHSGQRTPARAPTCFGNARLRSALYMPTIVAIKRNPWIRAFYERLVARGKTGKVAVIACMRKLLVAIYVVARDKKPFVPNLAGASP